MCVAKYHHNNKDSGKDNNELAHLYPSHSKQQVSQTKSIKPRERNKTMTNTPQTSMHVMLDKLNRAANAINAHLITINMRYPTMSEDGTSIGSLSTVVGVSMEDTVQLSSLIAALANEGIEVANVNDSINIIGNFKSWTLTIANKKGA